MSSSNSPRNGKSRSKSGQTESDQQPQKHDAEPKPTATQDRWLKPNEIDRCSVSFCTYLPSFTVLDSFVEDMRGTFAYEFDGKRFVRFQIKSPQAEMLVSCTDPVRMQVRKELLRVAEYFKFLAETIGDLDYTDAEIRHFSDDLDFIRAIGEPPTNLLSEHLATKFGSIARRLEGVAGKDGAA